MQGKMAATQTRAGTLQGQVAIFLGRFLKSPVSIGSPLPSSDRLVQRLLDPLPWPRLRTIVEYGPGTGAFTREILARMAPDARLVTLELDHAFTRALREMLPDPRLTALTGTAENVIDHLRRQGLDHADCIVSGLPFSTIPPQSAERILASSRRLLGTGGIFAAYQVRAALGERLRAHFGSVRQGFEWRHMPPCRLYWASNGPEPLEKR